MDPRQFSAPVMHIDCVRSLRETTPRRHSTDHIEFDHDLIAGWSSRLHIFSRRCKGDSPQMQTSVSTVIRSVQRCQTLSQLPDDRLYRRQMGAGTNGTVDAGSIGFDREQWLPTKSCVSASPRLTLPVRNVGYSVLRCSRNNTNRCQLTPRTIIFDMRPNDAKIQQLTMQHRQAACDPSLAGWRSTRT